jgi:hypothetical protein
MWCKKRSTNKNLVCRFGDGKHRFYFETVCGAKITDATSNLCSACLQLNVQTKTQDVRTFPHGLVSGPYTKESHIFDSPWYLENVKTYGAPLPSSIELAMKSQSNARAGIKTASLDSLQKDVNLRNIQPTTNSGILCNSPMVPVGTTPTLSIPVHTTTITASTNIVAEQPKKKRAPRKKDVASLPIIPASDAIQKAPIQELSEPKKKRAPRKRKEVVIPSSTIIESTVLAQLGATNETIISTIPNNSMIETMDTPLEVKDVVKVVLRPFTHNTIVYWYDSSLDKVYKRKQDGSLGMYVGRYDSYTDRIIHSAPDSDED